MGKTRLDQALVSRGLVETRARAQAMVLAGVVFVEGERVDKAGALVPDDADVAIQGSRARFVSRGGDKLDAALDTFAVDPGGKRCLDVGASTGGFTDCLLQRAATQVIAVDVGYGQLAYSLRIDPRVVVLERTNARSLDPAAWGGPVDLTVVDASFIGLAKLGAALARCTREGGDLVALVKPQFEVGRHEASRGRGVVRDPHVRARAIADAAASLVEAGFKLEAQCDSTVKGPKGNVEAFVWATRPKSASP